MFANQRRPVKDAWRKWLIPGLIVGAGLLLVFVQTLTPPPPPGPSESPPPQERPLSQDLPAEYDPTATPFLDASPPDEKPLWRVGAELALKLLFVLGLIYVTLAGLRRLQGSSRKAAGAAATIRVVESVALAPGRSLHLIAAGDKTLLIGATDHQVSLLTELENSTVPLDEEPSGFETALAKAEKQALPPEPGWEAALAELQAGIRRMRATAGESRNVPER